MSVHLFYEQRADFVIRLIIDEVALGVIRRALVHKPLRLLRLPARLLLEHRLFDRHGFDRPLQARKLPVRLLLLRADDRRA
jgi:hypothetical protein